MTPEELREEKAELQRDFKAIKSVFGGLLLESTGTVSPEDVAYYQRKFKEAQDKLRRM